MSGLESESSGGSQRRRRNDDTDDQEEDPKKDTVSDVAVTGGRNVRPRLLDNQENEKDQEIEATTPSSISRDDDVSLGHDPVEAAHGDSSGGAGVVVGEDNGNAEQNPRAADDDISEHEKDYSPVFVQHLSPELKDIFSNLESRILDLKHGIEPPEVEEMWEDATAEYREEVEQRFPHLDGKDLKEAVWSVMKDYDRETRYLDQYEEDLCESLDSLMNDLEKQIKKCPILARVINENGRPLIATVDQELDEEYEYYFSDDERLEYLSSLDAGRYECQRSVTKLLIEQNPRVLHYRMGKAQSLSPFDQGMENDFVINHCVAWKDYYWVAKNYPWAYCEIPSGASSLPSCDHQELIEKAMVNGDLDFVRRFYGEMYPLKLSQIADKHGRTVLHMCAKVLLNKYDPYFFTYDDGDDDWDCVGVVEWVATEHPEAATIQSDEAQQTPLHMLLEVYFWDKFRRYSDIGMVVHFLVRSFPNALTVQDENGKTPFFLLCANFHAHAFYQGPDFWSRYSEFVKLMVQHCPEAARLASNDENSPYALMKLTQNSSFYSRYMQGAIIYAMRCLYPDFPITCDVDCDEFESLIRLEAPFATMRARLVEIQAVLEKRKRGHSPDNSQDFCEAIENWTKERLEELGDPIETVADYESLLKRTRFEVWYKHRFDFALSQVNAQSCVSDVMVYWTKWVEGLYDPSTISAILVGLKEQLRKEHGPDGDSNLDRQLEAIDERIATLKPRRDDYEEMFY